VCYKSCVWRGDEATSKKSSSVNGDALMSLATPARGGPRGAAGPGSAVLQYGNTGLNTSGTRYLQPGYSGNAAGTSQRSAPSPIVATSFTLYLSNNAAGTVSGGTGTYAFQVGTITNDVFTGSGTTVTMAVADRQASVSGSISVSAGQRVAIQFVVGGTGTITGSPSEVEATLVLNA
jgi:hypothetical protein